ncbi:suppressor of fused domain protein [Tumidithrix elongata RA019]|uniref:Suppressor of fused domain protein n=1 Tax=Tumidithrix elongata BACA0141 TaxID=2716417 RepID=A0AAW9Q691_9CYAN|nr:suppressor of fused domain protein [Tumidithrix elongata RA019]
MSFLEESWVEREEIQYKKIFGLIGKGIYPLSFELFENQFGTESVDPTWLHYGVFVYPPTEKRNSWVYVTSGMSNPWGAEEKMDFSGLGVEFLMETLEEISWGISVLQSLMAYNILLSVGRFGDRELLNYGDRVPLAIQPPIQG